MLALGQAEKFGELKGGQKKTSRGGTGEKEGGLGNEKKLDVGKKNRSSRNKTKTSKKGQPRRRLAKKRGRLKIYEAKKRENKKRKKVNGGNLSLPHS
jgi:hypothetical protein